MMKHREFTIKFCAYSVDPRFTIPGTDEYGQDIEYNCKYIEKVRYAVDGIFCCDYLGVNLDVASSIVSPLLIRLSYHHDDAEYVVNFLTDSNPWPQKDPQQSYERMIKVQSGECGQTWWLHHVELSDGTEYNVDEINNQIAKSIKESVKKDFQKWLVTIRGESAESQKDVL